MKQRVSDLITSEEINKWNEGDIITIEAGTGVGKSYFIKNILYDFAKEEDKKILMLIHRSNCVEQFTNEIVRDEKIGNITIMTYQALEYRYRKKHEIFDFSEYKYIVCDEFHYFIGDAGFNKTTDISLNMILNTKIPIKIFMSATGEEVKKYINNVKKLSTIDYKIPITYDFINELMFFYKDETMEQFIKKIIETKQKAIIFIQSAKKAYDFYKEYEDYCLFNCSKSNRDYYRYVDVDKINDMLKNEKFEEQILISTTCLDAGVNIIDKEVNHIVIDVKDIGSLIQCMGRKRIQNKNDKINVYIKAITNNQLGGMETQLKNKLNQAEYLKEHSVKEYIQVYGRDNDYSNIVYDYIVDDNDKGTKKINELMYFKCKNSISKIQTMKTFGDFGYCKYLAFMFGFLNKEGWWEYKMIEEEYEKENLEKYLDSIVGEKLFKDEQQELINKIDVRVNGRQQKSYKKLNNGLEMLKMPYVILPKRSSEKRYWIIEKIDI